MERFGTGVASVCRAWLPWLGARELDDVDESDEWEERDGTITASERPPDGGGFINNGLHDPQVGGLDPAHPLDTIAGLDGAKLGDPDRLATARYVVECALPAGESVSKSVGGASVEFHGALGLAPEWQGSACDGDCQEWVSACVLARTNVSGQPVALSLRGDHPALGLASHPGYPNYEASFFGNLFEGPDEAYMCPGLGLGPVLAQLDGRTCSNLVGGWCDFTTYLGCELGRCQFVGGLSPVAIDCRAGVLPRGPSLRTITSYVAMPL